LFWFFLFFAGNAETLFGQTDSLSTGYYNFVLIDSSNINGNIVFEDDDIIELKLLSGGDMKFKKELIVTQKYVVSDTIKATRFELKGGSILIGTVIKEDKSLVTINLLSGSTTTIKKQSIINREIVSSNIKNGEYWSNDPNKTRLFFAPTGFGLKSGDGYFAAYEIFFPMVAVGVLDHLTLAGGVSLFPGSSQQIFYFAPKLTIYQNNQHAISIGDFYVKYPDNEDYLNIVYAVGTASFNNDNGTAAITAGIGFETSSKEPMILIGGELRISRYAKLISENWVIINNDFSFASFGIRFLGKYLAADFAFILPLVKNTEINLFPWIGFAYNF
jgi:hypothetical protein